MDIANEINTLLDELYFAINNNAEEAEIVEIKEKLNCITHQGERALNIFTNDYYVNNMMLDKVVINEQEKMQ